MKPELLIGLVGDQNPEVTAHRAIPIALQLAAKKLDVNIIPRWLPTQDVNSLIEDDGISKFDALWFVPASPYRDTNGALRAIQVAREELIPTLGTCGGFQHMAIEFAQNELGLANADNAEINPHTTMPLIAPLSCALIEVEGSIEFSPDSTIANIYKQLHTTEKYHCSFGLNSEYRHIFEDTSIKICGTDENAEPRALEHKEHPFFIGVAFQPERSALQERRHPLITAFAAAAMKHSTPETEISND